MNKKVSVIIPCYNNGKYIEDAINSVLAQTYNDIEIVCVNDGSTDNSPEIIKTFADKYKNILFFDNQENKGVIYARNIAIEACHGEYILPLDADDTIESTYLEKAVKILDENPNIGIVYCKAMMFGSKNEYWNLDNFDKSNILYNNCIFCTALFRKKDFIKVGMYKDYMQFGCEDYDLWLSFIEQGFDVYQIDEILFNYRQYDEDSRTMICKKNQDIIWRSLVKNHLDLYLNDKQFIENLIFSKIKSKEYSKKYNKYKKLFNILLPVTVVELFTIIILIITIIWSMNG